MFILPHTFVCCPICLYTPRGVHAPHMPPYASMPLCVLEDLHVVGVVMGSPLCWDTLPYIALVLGCLPFITPTLSHWFPVHQYAQVYQYVM